MISRNAPRDDEGAVAIMVAILSLVLFGLAAFAVDFGSAYAAKRQLSVSADAAALAGAQAAAAATPAGAACNAVTLTSVVQNAAATTNAANDRAGSPSTVTSSVSCTTNGIEVTASNQRTVKTIFGGIFGVSSITPAASATTVVQVPNTFTGLRPIAACAATTTANTTAVSSNPALWTKFVVWISKDSAVCGTSTPGQWGFANFLDQGAFGSFNTAGSPAYNPNEVCAGGSANSGGNAGCQAAWVAAGYGGPVTVPNRATNGSTGISGNTGLANSSGYVSAMQALVGKTIQLPVANTFVGNRLDTVGVVSVVVCAVKLGRDPAYTTGAPVASCTPSTPPAANPDLAGWNGLKNNEGALWVQPVTYAQSGVFGGTPTCQFGSSCDLGTRSVSLIR